MELHSFFIGEDKMKALKKIFRIYTDASVAVLMAAGCLIETVCTLALPSFFHILTIPAAAFFGIVSVCMAASVYKDAKKSNII